MGPRGCNYLHFISAIGGGEVIKIPNLSRVKRVPKFKSIEEIYVSIGSECDGLSAKCPPKVDRSLAVRYGCDEDKTEVKIESAEDEYESDFDVMTLKQLQITCKFKKRKASILVNLMAVKQEDIGSQHQDDEPDLEETLGSWKRKMFKKTKAKKSSAITNSLQGKSEAIPHDHNRRESSSEICKPIRIKVEDDEYGWSQLQPISYILPDKPVNATSEIGATIEDCCADQDTKTTLGGFQSTSLSGNSHEHFQHPMSSFLEVQSCSINQASYEHLENYQLMNPLISGDSKVEVVNKVTDIIVRNQSLDLLVVKPRKEEGMTDVMMHDVAALQTQNCVLNQVSYKHLESVKLWDPLVSEGSKFEDFEEVDNKAVLSEKSLASSVSELMCEEGMSIIMTCEVAPETVFLECDESDLQVYSTHHSSALGSPHHRDNSMHIQAPRTGPDRICENIDSVDDEKVTSTVKNNEDVEAKVTRSVVDERSSTVKSSTCLPSANTLASRGNAASSVEDKKSSTHNVTTTSSTCLPDIPPLDSDDLVLTGSSASDRRQDDVPHPPERLFSARKTISPNSQERLCRVMNSITMQEDTEINSCREKLSFGKYCKDKSPSSKSDIKRARIIFTSSRRHEAISNTNTRQAVRKGKDERKSLYSKGGARGPHASHIAQQASIRCSSIQQNAILFSQQQMNDIERLAQKLVSEMQSMKDIFVDALQCESRTGAKLRYDTDKVRVAVENATKAEETTRKWLSMMTRDCNRFCKIMRLAETDAGSPEKTDTGSPEKTSHKERKITFADEAGGSLCDVRVFEASEAGNGVASLVEYQTRGESLGA